MWCTILLNFRNLPREELCGGRFPKSDRKVAGLSKQTLGFQLATLLVEHSNVRSGPVARIAFSPPQS